MDRYGLEGLIKFKRETEYDAERYQITLPVKDGPMKTIGIFDRVMVEITTEQDRSTQRGRVKMSLIEPVNSEAL